MAVRSRRLQLATLLIAGCCLMAQSKSPETLAAGKILVTPRGSPDPLFAESVILLVKYNADGALGLMVNRRSTLPISRALKQLQGAAAHSEPVFVGGPVELDTVLALTRAAHQPDGADGVAGDIYLITERPVLEKALGDAANPDGLRIFLGYCGWGPHQLQNEARIGGWYIFDHSEDLAFDSQPSTLWSRLIKKAEAQLALLPRLPRTEARLSK